MSDVAAQGPHDAVERAGDAPVVESFQTDDLQVAETFVQRVYPKAELRESKQDFRFQQLTRSEGGIGFTRFRFSSWMDIQVEFEQVAAFGLVLGGDYTAYSNTETLDTARPFLFTPGIGGSKSQQLDLLMVNIDVPTLAAAASTDPGTVAAGLRFGGTSPTSTALETHWRRTLGYAWKGVVEVEELFRNDLIRSATFEAVLAAAVAAFPLTATGTAAAQGAAASRAVRRAQDFVDAHADSPLTVQQIAAAAGVSVRALQLGFRRDLDLTPLQYLRRRRLEAARAALLAAAPDELLITRLAQQWGYSNSGRFIAQYEALFGERPSVTLRR